ncbi:MAG: hypothetical protein H0U39_08250 [Segetibacter sp.]|nr:hypothetical protein [Segetibacter sp.]
MKELLIKVPNETVPSLEQFVKKIGGSIEEIKRASDKEKLLSEIKEAVEEMKLIKSGKKQARNAESFLDDL